MQTITIPRGNTFTTEISLTNGGEPFFISSGDKLFFTVKRSYGGETVIRKELTVDDYSDENLVLELRPGDTSGLAAAQYLYDIGLLMENGEFYTVADGVLSVTSVVTEVTET